MTVTYRLTISIAILMMIGIARPVHSENTVVLSMPEESFIQYLSAHVVTQAYKRIGYDVQIRELPNARALSESTSGNLDGEVSRIAGIELTHPDLLRIPIAVNKLEGIAFSSATDIDIKTWDDLRGYTIICVRGIKFVEQNLQERNINCSDTTYISQAIKMLEMKRGDILILPRLNGLKYLSEQAQTNIKPVSTALVELPLYHYIHKSNQRLYNDLLRELKSMEESGEIRRYREAFMQKHFPLSSNY